LQLNWLLEDVNEISDSLDKYVDPILKEIRQFETIPSPIIYRAAISVIKNNNNQLYPLYDTPFSTRSFNSWYPTGYDRNEHINTTTMIIESFVYVTEKFEKNHYAIKINLSDKVTVDGITINAYVAGQLRRLSLGGIVPVLRDLVEPIYPVQFSFIKDPSDVLESGPISYLIELLFTGNNSNIIKEGLESFQNMYGFSSQEVTMKIEFKDNKGYRAYFVDKCWVRHLLGSIIHSILSQPNTDNQDWRADIYPANNADTLDLSYILQPGESLMICLGDISSFSASLLNIIVMVLTLVILISKLKAFISLHEPFLVKIKGELLEVRLYEVLYMYLLLVVGLYAKTPYGGIMSVGGYLGVAGNVTLCRFTFSVILKELVLDAIHQYNIKLYPRLAGDDFALILIGDKSRFPSFVDYAQSLINKSIGRIKVLDTTLIESECEIMLESKYCKRRVIIKSRKVGSVLSVHIQSLTSLPLPSVMLKNNLSPIDKIEEIISLYNSLSDSLKDISQKEEILSWYISSYRMHFDLYHSVPIMSVNKSLIDGNYQWVNKFLVDYDTYNKILNLPHLEYSQGVTRFNDYDKLLYLLSTEQEKVTELSNGVLYVGSMRNVVNASIIKTFVPTFQSSVPLRFYNIFSRLREANSLSTKFNFSPSYS